MKSKKKRRREPTAAELREPIAIPDTPENIARACLNGPPKKRWPYLEEREQRKEQR